MTSERDRPDGPQAFVEAPLRRTLGILLAHLLGLFLIAVMTCVVPILCRLPPEWDIACPLVVPTVLVGYVLLDGARRWCRRAPVLTVPATAWTRAGELDPDLATLVQLVGVFAAMAVAVAVGFLLMHLAADPVLRDGLVPFLFVGLGTAYIAGVQDWVGDWGRRLGRRCDQMDARFRAYWAAVGGR